MKPKYLIKKVYVEQIRQKKRESAIMNINVHNLFAGISFSNFNLTRVDLKIPDYHISISISIKVGYYEMGLISIQC